MLQSLKISGPNSVTHPTQTPIYMSGVWLGVDPRTDTKNHHVSKRDRTTCSKFINHSRLNTQQLMYVLI